MQSQITFMKMKTSKPVQVFPAKKIEMGEKDLFSHVWGTEQPEFQEI